MARKSTTSGTGGSSASPTTDTSTTSKGKKKKAKGKRAWKLMGTAVGAAAAVVTTKSLDATWHTATGRRPPSKPENPEIAGREALVWAAISGMAMGVAKTYATRRVAQYWVKSFGELPPGMAENQDASSRKSRSKLKAQARE